MVVERTGLLPRLYNILFLATGAARSVGWNQKRVRAELEGTRGANSVLMRDPTGSEITWMWWDRPDSGHFNLAATVTSLRDRRRHNRQQSQHTIVHRHNGDLGNRCASPIARGFQDGIHLIGVQGATCRDQVSRHIGQLQPRFPIAPRPVIDDRQPADFFIPRNA